MKKLLTLLALTFTLTGISQPPTTPIRGSMTNNAYAMDHTPVPKRTKQQFFNVSCPHCGSRQRLSPLTITTNGFHSAPGGNVIERTVTFSCSRVDCAEDFTAKNEKFIPQPIAVEDTNAAPPQSMVMPSEPLDSPPVITFFDVRNSTPLDFPIKIAFNATRYVGPCYDPLTGITATNAFHLTWPANSNWFYTSWFGPKLTGSDWTEWPITNVVHPARSNFIASAFVPIYRGSSQASRFYQVRATSSQGITYGP